MTRTCWLIELVPAFEYHPPFEKTFYAGYWALLDGPGKTFNPAEAPQWETKEAAELVAARLSPTISCVWKVVPHICVEPDNAITAGLREWLNVRMKEYTEAQYGKGDIRKLLNETEKPKE